jgi:hypothetical protein
MTDKFVHGIYKHYKGNFYKTLFIAYDTKFGTNVVVYEPLYECKYKYFTRPVHEWFDFVVPFTDKGSYQRFRLATDEEISNMGKTK